MPEQALQNALSQPTSLPSYATVLVVDLDGTLSRTDTLHEAILDLLSKNPFMIFSMLLWLLQGKPAFKDNVAMAKIIPSTGLPLNADVIDQLKIARYEGRRTALVTASDQRQADAVASGTDLFDEAHGSNRTRTLRGKEKADFLTEKFGAKGFDYIGDSRVDVPVWTQSRRAITVNASSTVRRSAERVAQNVEHLSPRLNRTGAFLRALRPHQWSKNLLLFLPLLASHDLSSLGTVTAGFIAFCLAASAIYILNDLCDLADDRAHPRKSKRPFAAGDLTIKTGLIMALLLLVSAACLSFLISQPAFAAVLLAYLISTLLYSFWLKRRLLIDILILAGLYTLRIIAGGAVIGLYLSPWLLGFSMFLFLGLAAVKRQAELTDQIATGRVSEGRAYLAEDLPLIMGLALSSSMAAVLVFALYISSDAVQVLYSFPAALWLLCPIILYWQLRMIAKAHRGQMTDDPILFATVDRTSQLTILVAIAIATFAAFANP